MEIRVPRMNASDDTVMLREWLVESGEQVQAGQGIAVCETSKSAFEVSTSEAGFLHFQAPIDEEIAVGALLAVVTSQASYDWSQREPSVETVVNPEQRVSKRARALIEEHQIDMGAFAGLELVSEGDVSAYLARQQPLSLSGDKVVVVGGRGHGRVCIDVLRQNPQYEIVGLVDDNMEVGTTVLGVPVLGTLADLPQIYESGVGKAVMAIACILNLSQREELCARVRGMGFEIPNLIHPRAIIEPSARMGRGVQVLAGAIVGSLAQLHDDCVINHGSIVSHDCIIHRGAHLAPGCILAGAVEVGSNTLMGMGATAYMWARIGANVIVHNGQNIMHDIPDGEVVS